MGKRRDEPDEPTLELPSFFRRRKRRADDAASSPAVENEAQAGDATPQPPPETPAAESTRAEPRREPEPAAAESAPADPEPRHQPAETAPTVTGATSGDAEDTTVLEPAASTAETQRPAPAAPDAPTTAAPDAHPEPEPTSETAQPDVAPAEPEPTSEPPQAVAAPAAGGRRAARSRRARAPRSRPTLSAGAASLVAGAVVGLVGAGLTWAALQGCEALRGTDSCGGPGLLVLVAILALMVVAGALLLKALRVSEPNATSFLGVGLMTVIVLVTLMESLFSAWMFLAVPVLTALSYLGAQWVSTRFVDTEEPSPGVDVR